ncbi:MAG: hypothetical protein PHW69_07205, partial [Elusimicrobiaceae bacterium]|nr:hypothetical protein [Elusimicrobiaceae bacterium]
MHAAPRVAVCGLAALAGLVFAGCATPKIVSGWQARPLTVDGAARDWTPGNNTDASGFIVAAVNDDKYLYFYAEPDSSSARKILSQAADRHLTIWLNADERKERTLGIQFGSAPDAFPGTARREPEPAGPAEQTGADRLSGNAQDELDEPQEPAPREINPEP